MTLYPKVRNIEKGHLVIKLMIFISFLTMLICSIVNVFTSTKYLWCLIVGIGIIYLWITVMYSLKRNINIGSNVMVQSIAISILVICIDFIMGYNGWAINYAIPIIIGIANITILVLTIVSVNKYYKYAIYQLIIFILSIIPMVVYIFSKDIITKPIFTIISSIVAVFTFVFSLILCGNSIAEELDRRLHM